MNQTKRRTYEEIYGIEKAKELKEQRRKWALDHPLSAETRIKIGKSNRGIKKPLVSQKLKGRKLSVEHYQKVVSQIRKRNSDENYLRKFSLAMIASYDKRGIVRCGKYPREFNKELRKSITLRDRNCIICGSNKQLSVHHIDYNTKNNTYDNLCSLCRSCHMRTNYNRRFWGEFLTYILLIGKINIMNILQRDFNYYPEYVQNKYKEYLCKKINE